MSVAPVQKSSKKPARGIQKSKNAFSMQQIAKVLDKANKADIKLLKDHWQEVIDHAKNNDKKSLVSLLQNSEPVAASEDHVLVKFEEEIHCEIVNKDDEKRSSIESVVCNIVNKTLKLLVYHQINGKEFERSIYKIVKTKAMICQSNKHNKQILLKKQKIFSVKKLYM